MAPALPDARNMRSSISLPLPPRGLRVALAAIVLGLGACSPNRAGPEPGSPPPASQTAPAPARPEPTSATSGSLRQAEATSSSTGSKPRLLQVATFPDIPIAQALNKVIPGLVDNDRKLMLGGVGSDLWHSPDDPPNTLRAEGTIVDGGGAQNGSNRWGDYSSMNLDPSDGCTFWYTNEFYGSGFNLNWRTKIGTFKFATCGK